MNVFIHSCFICFDIAGNEAVYDVELEVNEDNKDDFKLIDKVEMLRHLQKECYLAH